MTYKHIATSILSPWAKSGFAVSVTFFLPYMSVAREHIVGWYHTGPKLHPNDIAIHELIGKYCANPVSDFSIN